MPPPMKYLYAHKKKSVKKYFLTRSGEKSRSRRIPGGDFFTVVVGRSPSPCATHSPVEARGPQNTLSVCTV